MELYTLPYAELKEWQQFVAIQLVSDLFRRKLLKLENLVGLLVS